MRKSVEGYFSIKVTSQLEEEDLKKSLHQSGNDNYSKYFITNLKFNGFILFDFQTIIYSMHIPTIFVLYLVMIKWEQNKLSTKL